MTTQDISEKSVLRIMQREQERERRRIRDRQRRQSMSLEEREKHLARRRRNYQLRRQKADNSQSDSQCKQTSATTGGDQNTRNEYQAATNSSELCVQSEVITHIGLNQGQDKLDVSSIKFEDVEAGGHKLAKFPRRLRLSHVRHLARSINNPMDELTGDNHPIGADAVTKKNASTKFGGTDSGSPKRLRLNHVKRLARAVHSTVKESEKEDVGWRKLRLLAKGTRLMKIKTIVETRLYLGLHMILNKSKLKVSPKMRCV